MVLELTPRLKDMNNVRR